MTIAHRTQVLPLAVAAALFLLCALPLQATPTTTKQQSLDEWRNLTSPTAPAPRVFVKGDHVRFYFPTADGIEAFSAHWTRLRVPTGPYKVSSALVRWDQRLSRVPEHELAWREASVIAGLEWRRGNRCPQISACELNRR